MDLEKEILGIQERNRLVERDKAWELFEVRRIAISVMTDIVVAAWLFNTVHTVRILLPGQKEHVDIPDLVS